MCRVHSSVGCLQLQRLCQSEYSKRTKPWLTLMLENTTAPVTHTTLQGLTRLYLTPCVCGAMTDCVCARERLLSHMHSLMGVAPPLASYPSCLLFATSAARSLNSEVYTVNIVLIILMSTSCFDEHSGFPWTSITLKSRCVFFSRALNTDESKVRRFNFQEFTIRLTPFWSFVGTKKVLLFSQWMCTALQHPDANFSV